MKKFKLCEEKAQLWKSLPKNVQNWSKKQWQQIFDHTQNCKQCQEEIKKMGAWTEKHMTSNDMIGTAFNDILPGLLGIPPAKKRPKKEIIIGRLVYTAVCLFNNETDAETARKKINEYLLRKSYELGLNLIEN